MTEPRLKFLKLAVALLVLILGLDHPALAEPLAVSEVAPGVYLHQGAHEEISAENAGAIANVGFIVGAAAVAVIDSGGSAEEGRCLLEAIRTVTDLPVKFVINTHVHPDHVFGNAAFVAEGATFVGHAKLPRALATRGAFYLERLKADLGAAAAGSAVVVPDLTVSDRLALDLGGRRLVVTARRTAHTDNDVTVYDRASGTLWTGDLLFRERIPVVDGSLKGWLEVMAELRKADARQVVPGHGPPTDDWPAALDAQEDYLRLLRDEIRAVLQDGGTMEDAVAEVGQAARDRWQLFDDYHPRNVVTAFTELEWE